MIIKCYFWKIIEFPQHEYKKTIEYSLDFMDNLNQALKLSIKVQLKAWLRV